MQHSRECNFKKIALNRIEVGKSKTPSKKRAVPTLVTNITTESQIAIITLIETLNAIILPRRHIFLGLALRVLWDEPKC
jgi:hypothetical protein